MAWLPTFDLTFGEPHPRAFQGQFDHVYGCMYGFRTFLGSDSRVSKAVRTGPHRLVSAHEPRIVDDKIVFIEMSIPRTNSLKPWEGNVEHNWILSRGFQGSDNEYAPPIINDSPRRV